MINYLFQSDAIRFNLNMLNPSKSLPLNIQQSKKFSQIKKSLKNVGLIEPIIIYIDNKINKIKIIDGHLRVEALKELGEKEVKCLISTIYDTYTPNNKVSRITIIQEQKMLQKAIKRGVSIENLSEALDISADTLKGRLKILDDISQEVVNLFSNQHVPKATFYVLKKMKPMRQIECAHLMLNIENFTEKFALSLLHGTEPSLLNMTRNDKTLQKSGHRQIIERLEKEMAQAHVETEKLKSTYGINALKLVIIKSNLKKLLDNPKVLHWLLDNNSDFLSELRLISNIESLSNVKQEVLRE